MAITRKKKEEILVSLAEALRSAGSLAFIQFTGLTVHEASEMRRTLKKDSVRYTVVKKTLLKKALADHGYEGDAPELPGEVALAYAPVGNDATSVARSLQAFVKKFADKLTFLGGVIEGKYLSQTEAVSIATIPAPQILRGMFVNIINSPIQRFAIALGEVAKKKV
jgi:large subunit ribosomal protein L10